MTHASSPAPIAGWPPSVAPATITGVGSMPGVDPLTAQQRVLELLPDLPHLVELPDRGPGGDMIGRGATLLTDLFVDLQPAGWRLIHRPGRDLQRARDLLRQDLDALAEAADGYRGALKIQAVGPWTLAAMLELPRGDKAIGDRGAVADIGASLADGLAAHLERVRALVPGADIVVQLDEPALPAVRAGRLPTGSGFGALRVPDDGEVSSVLAGVLEALPYPGVHCCAAGIPIALLRGAGAGWVSLDTSLLTRTDEQALGEAVDAGTGVVFGVEPAAIESVRAIARRLGLAAEKWHRSVLLSAPCGLADRNEQQARSLLAALADAARWLAETVAE